MVGIKSLKILQQQRLTFGLTLTICKAFQVLEGSIELDEEGNTPCTT